MITKTGRKSNLQRNHWWYSTQHRYIEFVLLYLFWITIFSTNISFETNKCHHGVPPWNGGPGAIVPVAPPLIRPWVQTTRQYQSPFTIYLPVGLVEEQGWGTNLRPQAAWIVHFRLRAKKSIHFIPKLYLYLSMRKNDFSGLSIYKYLLIMDPQFDAMLHTTLSNDNSYADHIKCSHGPHLACGPLVTHTCCGRNISLFNKMSTSNSNKYLILV